jgi:hypothetical protein
MAAEEKVEKSETLINNLTERLTAQVASRYN